MRSFSTSHQTPIRKHISKNYLSIKITLRYIFKNRGRNRIIEAMKIVLSPLMIGVNGILKDSIE